MGIPPSFRERGIGVGWGGGGREEEGEDGRETES